MNWNRKFAVWRLNYGLNALIARVPRLPSTPTGRSWMVLLAGLGLLLLSGCAAPPPCAAPSRPPKELMLPPPPPGAMQDRLERILEKGQGQTSAPTSATSQPPVTP
jgi:hypothetical protein